MVKSKQSARHLTGRALTPDGEIKQRTIGKPNQKGNRRKSSSYKRNRPSDRPKIVIDYVPRRS